MFNGRPLYHGFPRPHDGNHDVAKSWLKIGNPTEVKVFVVENTFTAHIIDIVSVRGLTKKIPQVALYIKNEDVYIRVDFRLDGFIDILCNHTVSKGKIDVEVGIRFSNLHYYVEEITKVPQLSSTGKALKKKPKIKPVVGEYYNLYSNKMCAFNYQYIGTFTATEGINFDPYGDISGKKYHVFITLIDNDIVVVCFRSIPINIRKQYDGSEEDFTKQSTIISQQGSLGQYGFGHKTAISLDTNKKELSFIGISTNNNDYDAYSRGNANAVNFADIWSTIVGKLK